MYRLFFVPQYPVLMRYPEWWIKEFPAKFKKEGFEVVVLGEHRALPKTKDKGGGFSNIERAIEFECEQIKEFMDYNIKDEDFLLHADLSFPGIFHGALHHKPVKNAFAICHATSRNAYDYFAPVRFSKWPTECAHGALYKKVFVASEYHKQKLGWPRIVNLGALPNSSFKTYKLKKTINITSVARPGIQKVTKDIEKKVSKKFGNIYRQEVNSWNIYYKLLSTSKILLITSKEDTYNYSVIEAILNSSIPLAPNKCSFPELLPKEYLYNNINELYEKIEYYLLNFKKVPVLLNKELIENFYKNLTQAMKGSL